MMNVPEACLSFGTNYLLAPKLRPAGQDPYSSEVHYVFTDPIARGQDRMPPPRLSAGAVLGTLAGNNMVDDPRLWAGIWKSQFGGRYLDLPGVETSVSLGFYFIQIEARCGVGFRCAR